MHMKILIVEDEPIQLLHLKKLLSSYGKCHEAKEGKVAEELFERALSAGDPYHSERSRIIILTLSKEFTHITNAFALEAEGYLVKPVDVLDLEQKLSNLGLISA